MTKVKAKTKESESESEQALVKTNGNRDNVHIAQNNEQKLGANNGYPLQLKRIERRKRRKRAPQR